VCGLSRHRGPRCDPFQHLDETLEIEYALDPSTTYVDTPATASLTVTRPADSASTRMQVSPRLPVGLRRTTETAPSLTLGAGETEATVPVPLHADVAGEFTLPAPTVSLTDTFELYTEQLSRGPQPKLTVLPRRRQFTLARVESRMETRLVNIRLTSLGPASPRGISGSTLSGKTR